MMLSVYILNSLERLELHCMGVLSGVCSWSYWKGSGSAQMVGLTQTGNSDYNWIYLDHAWHNSGSSIYVYE